MCTYLSSYLPRIHIDSLEYVHLSQNLHIHYVHLGKKLHITHVHLSPNLHIHYVQIRHSMIL